MKRAKWIHTCVSAALVLAVALSLPAVRAAAQEHHDHMNFDDHDRQVSHDWWDHHRDHPPVGFRVEDRLDLNLEGRLKVGIVLNDDFRHRVHPVPVELLHELPAPAPHYRYVIIGGHVCLIDNHYRLADVIHLELP